MACSQVPLSDLSAKKPLSHNPRRSILKVFWRVKKGFALKQQTAWHNRSNPFLEKPKTKNQKPKTLNADAQR
jgi:hypothetical protein